MKTFFIHTLHDKLEKRLSSPNRDVKTVDYKGSPCRLFFYHLIPPPVQLSWFITPVVFSARGFTDWLRSSSLQCLHLLIWWFIFHISAGCFIKFDKIHSTNLCRKLLFRRIYPSSFRHLLSKLGFPSKEQSASLSAHHSFPCTSSLIYGWNIFITAKWWM